MPDRAPISEFESINYELALFSPELAAKEQIVVITKIDLPQTQKELPGISAWFEERRIRVFPISSATGEGIESLLDEIAQKLWCKPEEVC